MGIKENIISPTFLILRSYKGRLILYHLDLYRIDITNTQIDEITHIMSFSLEYPYGKGVLAVEWGDKLKPFLSTQFPIIEVELKFDALFKNRRKLIFSSPNISITDYLS